MSEFTGNWFALLCTLGWPHSCCGIVQGHAVLPGHYLDYPGRLPDVAVDVTIKFAMIPALDKSSIPNICACIGCIACSRGPEIKFDKTHSLIAAVYVLSPLVTSALNNDLISIGGAWFSQASVL